MTLRGVRPWLMVLILLSWISPVETSGAEMVSLKRLDGGKDFCVSVGTVIQVELEERGATGYLWQLDSLDQRMFDLERINTQVNGREGMTGTPVTKVWRLKTKQTGKARLEFSYCRPWEGKVASLDRFVVDISVQ
jgi:predicted secreted protein